MTSDITENCQPMDSEDQEVEGFINEVNVKQESDPMTNGITNVSGILTNEMIMEEKHLHQESVKEEEKIKEKQTEVRFCFVSKEQIHN